MRNRVLVLMSMVALIAAATIFALGKRDAVMAHFQQTGGPMQHGFGPEMLDHIARELNLTEAQKTQVKALFEAGQNTMAPLHQKMDEVHKQLESATENGQFDEAQVRALASQQAQLMAEMIVEHERMKSKIFTLLTPEQRAKATEMLKRHSEHFWNSGMHGA
ncbi:MAG TPA: Spy/CpxP family protein refolding chaperone [Pyrinomonadaceae bacterium]